MASTFDVFGTQRLEKPRMAKSYNETVYRADLLSRTKHGWFTLNLPSMGLKRGRSGISPITNRFRVRNAAQGWGAQLTQSQGSIKAPGGRGQSSEDTTREVYSTRETRMGTRAWDTNEQLNEKTGKFGRTWAGFKALSANSMNQHYDSRLSIMFNRRRSDVGFARRVQRSGL